MKHPTKAPPMLYVLRSGVCAGFILNRGHTGFEAFDADQHSIGLFADQCAAAAAVNQASHHEN